MSGRGGDRPASGWKVISSSASIAGLLIHHMGASVKAAILAAVAGRAQTTISSASDNLKSWEASWHAACRP